MRIQIPNTDNNKNINKQNVVRLTDLLERRGEERGISQLVLVGEEWNSRLRQFVRVHLSAPSHPQASQHHGLLIRIRIESIRTIFGIWFFIHELKLNFNKVNLHIIMFFLYFTVKN
jgi:hypothetical protein